MLRNTKQAIQQLKSGMLEETMKLIVGKHAIHKLQKKYGKDTHIIFMRGATGDTYLQLLLLEEYVRQKKIKKFIIAGDARGVDGLSAIFPVSDYLKYSVYQAECIEKTYLFLNGQNMNLRLFFLWSNAFQHNKCRIRMTERFNFMDSYKNFVLELTEPVCLRTPHFLDAHEDDFWRWQKQGILSGKTVIISPDANSVTGLPVWFWNSIILELKEKGFTVFVNCNYYNYYRAADIFFSYHDSVPLLEYAGFFMGVRSGLCDIISSAKCEKIIIYPEKQKEINYSEHRTEIEFSGLEIMGLVDADSHLHEIATPLIRNITDKESLLEGSEDYFTALRNLRNSILEQIKEKQEIC